MLNICRWMPSDLGAGTNAEIEEERRLFNVATTRAKDDPRLLVPQWFLADGQASRATAICMRRACASSWKCC